MTTPDERPPTNDLASRIDDRARGLSREAEAAANRLAAHPVVRDAADSASRIWGLVLMVAGLWLTAAITLRLDLPSIAWVDLWPVLLIVLGGLIIVRGLARRR